jgi:hypothetical protein
MKFDGALTINQVIFAMLLFKLCQYKSMNALRLNFFVLFL